MARRCGIPNRKCPTPRANWWKQSLGVDWFNHNTSGGSEPSDNNWELILTNWESLSTNWENLS